jgi:hypothetical protein
VLSVQRYRQIMNGSSGRGRVVTLMPDHGHPWPLWEEGAAHPDDYDLSAGLRSELASWYDDWSQHFNYKKGWDDADMGVAWSARGSDIESRLSAELFGVAEVAYSGQPW